MNYSYDSFNRMIQRQTGTFDTRFGVNTQTRDQYFTGYEGINPTLEFETVGTTSAPAATEADLKHRYLWGPNVDQLLADEQYGAGTGGASSPSAGVGNTLWALADHLGTIRDIADFDTVANPGVFSVVNHRVFDSFGNLTSQTSTSPSASIAFRYTGKFFDDLTGLSHHWNRWYDPKLGKWISEDPIGFAGGDANLGRYVGNFVVSNVDSNGLFVFPPLDIIWDIGSVIYDVGKIGYGAATGNPKLIGDGCIDLACDGVSVLIPYVPAGATKIPGVRSKIIDWFTGLLSKAGDDLNDGAKKIPPKVDPPTPSSVPPKPSVEPPKVEPPKPETPKPKKDINPERTRRLNNHQIDKLPNADLPRTKEMIEDLKWYRKIAKEALEKYENDGYEGIGVQVQKDRLGKIAKQLEIWGVWD